LWFVDYCFATWICGATETPQHQWHGVHVASFRLGWSVMAIRYLALAMFLSAASLPARGEIYECIDQSGNKRFTNIPAEARGCRALNVPTYASAPPVQSAPMVRPQPHRTPAVATPASFPRVDRQVQQHRDNDRRRILEQELGQEEKLLAEARRELSQHEGVAGNNGRNPRIAERVEPLQKQIRLHESNVANLRREISKIR
jgi:hypothetical protein